MRGKLEPDAQCIQAPPNDTKGLPTPYMPQLYRGFHPLILLYSFCSLRNSSTGRHGMGELEQGAGEKGENEEEDMLSCR